MSNKMALDALTAALDAMEHMANTLNNMDAVDEDEDAQHDAAFEAVRVAIAELKKPQKSRIVAAPMASYPEADQRFFNFWYGHMFEDLMQPPLVGIDHATARYIWNAAAIAALQEPQGWGPIETAPKDGSTYLVAEYNPLLIDGVQHDPLCLKVYRSPLKECDCGASSRAAHPSQGLNRHD